MAFSVGVGAHSDPDEFEGFYHLMEHMIFRGSKNYSDEDSLKDLILKF